MRYALALLLLVLCPGLVRAADQHAQQGEAYTHCLANAEKFRQDMIAQGYTNPYANGAAECVFHDRQGFGEPNDIYTGYVKVGSSMYLQNTGEGNHRFPRAAKCSAQPSLYAGYYQGSPKSCMNGCEFGPGAETEDWRYVDSRAAANAINFKRGSWAPTGNVCGGTNAPPTPPPPKDDYCAILDGGYKICNNSKGDPCVISGKTGRKYCGTKDQGLNGTNPERNENVTAGPTGETPGPPAPPTTPRPGEDWKQDRNVQITNVTNNTTQNVSVSNNAGTPNTNPGDGNPGDGSDNPGEGEGDEDQGSASGGTSCAAPPVCSGDPVGCAVLDQSWRNRCGTTKGDANGDGQPDWTVLGEGEGSNGVEPGTGEEKAKTWGLEDLLDKVDDSGFIGASCPSIPIFDLGPLGSYDPNGDWWCEALDLIGGMFVFIASCAAVRILVS